MNIGTEIITASVIVGPLCVMLWFFMRKWMERIETKIDMIMEYRLACRSLMVTREEYDKGMTRMHQRLDEHLAEEQELVGRLALLEGQSRQ